MAQKEFKVFIQSNKKQEIGALVAKHSLLSNSQTPHLFDIEIMMVEDFPLMMAQHGKTYLRNGHEAVYDRNDLQSFTLTRFAPPQLMNYQGRALVIDPDVFALPGTEVMNLFRRDMKGKSLLAVPMGNGFYKSSVMLLDCAKLKHWRWDQMIKDLFDLKFDYRSWSWLAMEPPGTIGELEPWWNDCDNLTAQTKFIHFTRRLTQPWKTGLPVDFKYDLQPSKYKFLPTPLEHWLRKKIRHSHHYETHYQNNDRQDQVRLFFQIARKALEEGAFNKEFVENSIRHQYVRPDFLQAMKENCDQFPSASGRNK